MDSCKQLVQDPEMRPQLHLQGGGPYPYSDVDSALIAPAELAEHYNRRFASFQAECIENVGRICESRLALRSHHTELIDVERLRRHVGQLQRRLAEVEVQSAKERIRALRLDSEHKDLHISQREHRDEIRRLLAAKSSPSAPAPPKEPLPPGASRCLVRLVETPGGAGEDIEVPADLWAKIRADVMKLTQELESFDASRAERSNGHTEQAALLEAQLETELSGLEGERERLADSLLGFVQLRSAHLSLQCKHAMEIDVLKACNRELVSRTQELSNKGRQKVGEVDDFCKRSAVEHAEFHRVAEVLERQHSGTANACLEDVCEATEGRVAGLVNETRALKERCAGARRRRKLALDGLRADLSLVAKKLAVLEQVAEQVSASLGQACGGTAKDPATCSPTAQRPLASPYAQNHSRFSAPQRCNKAPQVPGGSKRPAVAPSRSVSTR